jgi:hypothetical protein
LKTSAFTAPIHDIPDAQQPEPDLHRPSVCVGPFEPGPAFVRALAAGTSNAREASVQWNSGLGACDSAHHVHHFLAEELSHRRHHLPLLIHQSRDRRIASIQTFTARRHRIADVDAARRVLLDANLAQVVRLLVVDGILISSRARRPQRDDAVVE